MRYLSYCGKVLLFFSLFLITNSVWSQTANVRGFVYEDATGEPVIFTNVYLKGTTFGVSTNENGYYNISKVPPGQYILMVTFVGYDTLQQQLDLKPNAIITQNLRLKKSSIKLNVIDISSRKEDDTTQTQVSVTKITPREVNRIPSVGGTPDLAQYLQVLPGVIFTGDQGGQLYIRGGAPIQNKVILDGMIIYNPFHSIGLFSVFDMDIVRNAEIYTGGFPANYGGRISSVIDITTRDGNKKSLAGKISTSPFQSKLMLEGPLKKQKESGGGSTSFVFSGKSSYLEQTSKMFYGYVDTAGIPYNFNDFYGKISMAGENGSKFNLFGFRFDDQVNYSSVAKFNWDAVGGGTNFILIPGQSPMLIEGIFAWSKYKISLDEATGIPRTSEISGFNSGMDFTYFNKKNEFKYGFEVLGFNTDFQYTNTINRVIQQEDFTTEIAAYFKAKYIIKKVLIEPGFRAHYYSSLSNFSPEPRLAMKYNMAKHFRFKFSGGWFSQNLISATSDRDVVNLFYGFLSGPDNLQDEFDGKEVKHRLQKAIHGIGGVEMDLFKNATLNVEAYWKRFTQLTNINRNKLYDDNADNADIPDSLKKDFIIETGNARGADLAFKYDTKQIYIWAVYSLSFVDRFDGSKTYSPHYDRRHNVNLVGMYKFGKAKTVGELKATAYKPVSVREEMRRNLIAMIRD
ncbi:MAG: TonB-dependent receptor, partial [Bacteroidota bacterium]